MLSKIFTTVKYTLVSVNFLFVITGIVILSVGSSVQSAYNNYHQFLTDRFFSLPAFCIATGVIIFIIAFVGFYGAFKENYYLIMAFAGSMVIVFIFQLSACIAGYALKGNTVALVEQKLRETMTLYGVDVNYEVTKLWDEVQTDFECCGVTNASEWLTVPPHDNQEVGIPVSCCSHVIGSVNTFNCNQTNAFPTGCSDAFGTWARQHASAIGITGIFMVLLQALAVGGAVWMAKMSREQHESYP